MDGYGKVYKSVTRNPELTVEAVGIYAYLSRYRQENQSQAATSVTEG